jgi:hypothetical protein
MAHACFPVRRIRCSCYLPGWLRSDRTGPKTELARGPLRERARLCDRDTRLLPGEIAGEVTEVDRNRRDIIVRTDDGRRQALRYDFDRTKVVYHGYEYGIENLEAGDRIAFQLPPRSTAYVDTIRIQEPVQARSGASIARPLPPRPRTDVVEGTVERVDHSLGVFDIRPPAGRTVTVSVPYNARTADIDSFRALRRGDPVRVEGEFVNPESFQLLAFLSVR